MQAWHACKISRNLGALLVVISSCYQPVHHPNTHPGKGKRAQDTHPRARVLLEASMPSFAARGRSNRRRARPSRRCISSSLTPWPDTSVGRELGCREGRSAWGKLARRVGHEQRHACLQGCSRQRKSSRKILEKATYGADRAVRKQYDCTSRTERSHRKPTWRQARSTSAARRCTAAASAGD